MSKFLLLFCGIMLLSSQAFSQPTFVGSATCSGCHSEKYNDWVNSGHPYKFSVIESDQAPVYPVEAFNFQDSWMDSLGDGTHTWADIAGVIGGYGWKARFVGTDGYIIGTAGSSFGDAGLGHNQFNFYGGEEHGWVDYDAAKTTKIYNYGCFKCHTTGGDTSGTWLDGVEGLGTFTEGGVGCESCHGPASVHASTMSADDIDRVYEFAHQDNALGGLEIDGVVTTPDAEGNDVNFLCGTCHNRDYTDPINASSGFIKHHEQWDEFAATTHSEMGFTCITCHDPHKRVIWDGDGITKTCESCHSDKAALTNHSASATCIDCHMPYAAKSGTTRGNSGFKGDVRSHLWTITADTESMFTEDLSAVRDDVDREASLSPAYSCLGCHNDYSDDGIPDKTIETAAAQAAGMHDPVSIAIDDETMPTGFALKQNYPNPFNPATTIEFHLPQTAQVNLTVYNLAGQAVSTLINEEMSAGVKSLSFNADNLTSGTYFYKLTTKDFSEIKRMVYIK